MAILGDAGINRHMQQQEWNTIKEHILEQFRLGNIEAGLVTGVKDVGEKIKLLFPIQKDDRNELPNRVTTNKDVRHGNKNILYSGVFCCRYVAQRFHVVCTKGGARMFS